MTNYIDGFVLPVPRIYLEEYKKAAEKVAEIWKAYGSRWCGAVPRTRFYRDFVPNKYSIKMMNEIIDLILLQGIVLAKMGTGRSPAPAGKINHSKQNKHETLIHHCDPDKFTHGQ